MSIRRKQIVQVVNNIIKEELISGEFPSPRLVMNRLNTIIRRHGLGNPTMVPRLIADYPEAAPVKANPADYNRTMQEVYEDLSTIYEEIMEQADRLDSNFILFETEKERLEYEIEALSAHIKNLIMVADNSNNYVHSVYDYFADMSKIDMANTDAAIEIGRGVVISSKLYEDTKVDLSQSNLNFTIRPKDNIVDTREFLPIHNAVDEYRDSVWQYVVATNSKGTQSGEIGIDLDEPTSANRIKIRCHSTTSTNITVMRSPDYGVNWFTISSATGDPVIDIDFNYVYITNLRIILAKSEPDYIDTIEGEEPRFMYNFSVGDISLYGTNYKRKGLLQSIDHPIQEARPDKFINIDRVALWTVDEVPPGTKINYQLKVRDNWIDISPLGRDDLRHPQIIDLGSVISQKPEMLIMPKGKPRSVYEIVKLRANGIRFYKLGNVEGGVIGDSLSIYRGQNMWTERTNSGNLLEISMNDSLGYILETTEWSTPTYKATQSHRPGLITVTEAAAQSLTYKHSIAIWVSEAQRLRNTTPLANREIAIYLNGIKQYQGMPKPGVAIDYELKAGWNNIDVFSYVSQGNSLFIDVGIDLRRYHNHIYSSKNALKQVSMFELQHNVKHTDEDKYAIVTVGGERIVVLNHAPIGIPFGMFYKLEEDVPDVITMKAEFLRDEQSTDITPKLKAYEIRFIGG